jgi:hypothetical protein
MNAQSASSRRNKGRSSAWYKNGWVWMIIAVPLSAVASGGVILWAALESNHDLVVDDYYKEGLAINQTLDRDRAAARHGLDSVLYFDYDHNQVKMQLQAKAGYKLPAHVQLKIMHPIKAKLDHTVDMVRAADGVYRAKIPKLANARWYLQLEADDWRLLGALEVPRFSMIQIVGGPDHPNT